MPLRWKNCENIIKEKQNPVQGAACAPFCNCKCHRGRTLAYRGKVLLPGVTELQGNTRQTELPYWGSGGWSGRLRVERPWWEGSSKRQHNITVTQSTFHMPKTVLTVIHPPYSVNGAIHTFEVKKLRFKEVKWPAGDKRSVDKSVDKRFKSKLPFCSKAFTLLWLDLGLTSNSATNLLCDLVLTAEPLWA